MTATRLRPDELADALVREPELVDQGRVRLRLLDGVEVLAGDVLGQSDLEGRGLVGGPHQGRHRLEAGEARGAQTALAGDQLVARRFRAPSSRGAGPRAAVRRSSARDGSGRTTTG